MDYSETIDVLRKRMALIKFTFYAIIMNSSIRAIYKEEDWHTTICRANRQRMCFCQDHIQDPRMFFCADRTHHLQHFEFQSVKFGQDLYIFTAPDHIFADTLPLWDKNLKEWYHSFRFLVSVFTYRKLATEYSVLIDHDYKLVKYEFHLQDCETKQACECLIAINDPRLFVSTLVNLLSRLARHDETE